MSCNNCTATKSIPTCTTDLIIGQIEDFDTDVFVFVKNLTTGYSLRFEATSEGDGTVRLDMTLVDPSFYNPNSLYEIWITLQDEGQNQKQIITIDSETFDCFNLRFNTLFDEAGSIIDYLEHTLEVE